MSLLMKLVISILLVFSLVACKDVLDKPLSGMEAPASVEPLDGSWVGETEETRLDILKTKQVDWYEFNSQGRDKKTSGRFFVSYFKNKRVLNIDLASVHVNGQPLVSDSSHVFIMVGALVDDGQLVLIPADMDKFEKYFAQYFFATPIQDAGLCTKGNELCKENFSAGNVLYSKRLKKFNDELLKNYRTVFPSRNRVVFNPLVVASAH